MIALFIKLYSNIFTSRSAEQDGAGVSVGRMVFFRRKGLTHAERNEEIEYCKMMLDSQSGGVK